MQGGNVKPPRAGAAYFGVSRCMRIAKRQIEPGTVLFSL